MAEKKNQHYVPKFYLKRFATTDKKIYLYNIEKNILIRDGESIPYKDQFQEDYFYGDDKIWENKLNTLERKWDITFSNVIKGNCSNDDIESIKEFAVYQYGRTMFQLEQQTDTTAKITYEMLKCVLENKNEDSSLALDIAKKLSKKKAEEIMSPAKLLDLFQTISNKISDLEFKHMVFNARESFISSDNPIVVINPYVKNIGFEIIGLLIIFPISSKDLCILYDKKIYNKISIVNENCKNEYLIKILNSLFFVNAKSMIYSNNSFSKNIFNQTNRNLWVQNNTCSNVSSFGTRGDEIVAVHRTSIKYNKLPYFLMVNKEYEKINPDFRTPVPRKYDAGYEKKIQEEYLVIPKVLANSKNNQIDDEYIKNYESNHKKYYSLIMNYWKK